MADSPAQPTESTESTEPTGLAAPTGLTAPTGPTESTGLTESTEASGPAEASGPTGSTGPTEPTEPTGPTESSGHTEASGPAEAKRAGLSRQAARRAERLEARAAARAARATPATSAGASGTPDARRVAALADEFDKSLAADMQKPIGATTAAPHLYVVVDGRGFVGAFLSLAAAVELVHVRYAPLPFVIQRYPTAPGPVDTAYVVVLAANDAVLYVSNSQVVARRVNAAYNAIGIAVEDSSEYLRAPVGRVAEAAAHRLGDQISAIEKYAADAREAAQRALAAENPTAIERTLHAAGAAPTFPATRRITVIDAVAPFYFAAPDAAPDAEIETESDLDLMDGQAMRPDETVDDWMDRVLGAIPGELITEWECGAAAEEAARVAEFGDRANVQPATPADATPADATPADATPADATPADATPADATPADATLADAILTGDPIE